MRGIVPGGESRVRSLLVALLFAGGVPSGFARGLLRGEACRRALLAFGECAQSVACESIAGACAEEQRALENCPLDADGGGGTSGSGGSSGPSGVGGSSASGGLGGTSGSGGAGGASGSAGSGGGGCARFGLVASGVTCGNGCDSVRCDCEPFPRSFSYCTVDGCLIAANCAEVCATASLADVLRCTDVYTMASAGAGGLVATGFGLALPPGAEVAGITVRVRRRSRDGEVRDLAVRLVRGGDIQSVDRASPTPWPTTYSEAVHGGASDTWGASWSAADVASPGFGVALSAQWNGGSGDDVAGVDHVQVTLSYRYSCQ